MFYEPKRNLAPNGDLVNVDGSNIPLTWTAQNTTVTKDTVDFETGTYSLVLTKTAGGSTANVEVHLPLNTVKGQTLTVAVRMKVTWGFRAERGRPAGGAHRRARL